MTNHKPSFAASPSPLRSKNKTPKEEEFDVGNDLVGFGLQGVKVTDDELRELVEELGLDSSDAGDLVKGLGSSGSEQQRSNVSISEKIQVGPVAETEEAEGTDKEEAFKQDEGAGQTIGEAEGKQVASTTTS